MLQNLSFFQQKKAICAISSASHNTRTEPLFKICKILILVILVVTVFIIPNSIIFSVSTTQCVYKFSGRTVVCYIYICYIYFSIFMFVIFKLFFFMFLIFIIVLSYLTLMTPSPFLCTCSFEVVCCESAVLTSAVVMGLYRRVRLSVYVDDS